MNGDSGRVIFRTYFARNSFRHRHRLSPVVKESSSGGSDVTPDDQSICRRLSSLVNGGGGIRTHGTLAGTTVFKTVPFNHSGTPPERVGNCDGARRCYWATSSMTSSLTKIGTSTVTATAMASLGRE